ncbi:MAG: glycyl-radical enzyme activating protein [Victivallales bacterium]|nr:glycyl-radical enzyme activating protein [Victivallales bacterium]
MTGFYLNIKRFAVHDGPGIRTTIFLKGCPLKCKWCHNPESISPKAEVGFLNHKCIACGKCVELCPNTAHNFLNGKHLFDRSKCTQCGKCVEVCLPEALEYYGYKISVDKAVDLILEDKIFYDNSGGGATFSGGEPLLQAEFCAEVFKALRAEKIHCVIDTSGAVKWKNFETVLPYTNMFLYDLKHVDEKRHLQHVGGSNRLILENLERLSKCNIPIEIRIPVIPGFNMDIESINAIGETLSQLSNITTVQLLTYHDFGRSKFEALGKPNTMPKVKAPLVEQMSDLADKLEKFTLKIKY